MSAIPSELPSPFFAHDTANSLLAWPLDQRCAHDLWSTYGFVSIPEQAVDHNCFGEMSEVVPGVYLGPEIAIARPHQMLMHGAVLVISANSTENAYVVWEMVADTDAFDGDTVSMYDGRRMRRREVNDSIHFSTLLTEYISHFESSLKGESRAPQIRIFQRCIAADDNQFFDLSPTFMETSSLMRLVLLFRLRLEESWRGGEQCQAEMRVLPSVAGGPRLTTSITSFIRSESPQMPPSVAVHCLVGMSRSATLVLAYLMRATRAPRDELLALIKERRAIVQPNPGFMSQLLTWGACGYATVGDDTGCRELVAGILRLNQKDATFAPRATRLHQLDSLRLLLNVYIKGFRYSKERARLGLVFWGIVEAHTFFGSLDENLCSIVDILLLLLDMLREQTVSGVYVDCPGLFVCFCQIFKSIVEHGSTDGLAKLAMQLGDDSVLQLDRCGTHSMVGVFNFVEREWARVHAPLDALSLLCRAGFGSIIAVLGVSSHTITHCVDRFLGDGSMPNANTSISDDDFDFAWEPLQKYISASLSCCR